MNRLCLLTALSAIVFAGSPATATQMGDPKGLTKASRAYREYRLETTVPPYGLAKVEALIKKIKADTADDEALPLKIFNKLSVAEKFTYTMIHGEKNSQNCDGMPGILNEEKKIFAYVPDGFDDSLVWSDRQTEFMRSHRSKVVSLLRKTIKARSRVGLNLKQAIIEIDAYELIPDIITVYKRDHKDQDILTTCMVLMKDGKYKPFLASASYRKLYTDKDASQKTFIEANPANQKLTIARAMAYYKSRR